MTSISARPPIRLFATHLRPRSSRQLLAAANAAIDQMCDLKAVQGLREYHVTVALAIDARRVREPVRRLESEPFQITQQFPLVAALAPLAVMILDAEQDLPAQQSCYTPHVQNVGHVADMHRARGARGESSPELAMGDCHLSQPLHASRGERRLKRPLARQELV